MKKIDIMVVFEDGIITDIIPFDWTCSRLKPLYEKEYEKKPYKKIRWYKDIEIKTEI